MPAFDRRSAVLRWLALAGVPALAATAWLVFQSEESSFSEAMGHAPVSAEGGKGQVPSPPEPSRQQPGENRQGFDTGLEHLPTSLAGTSVPAGLKTDDRGRLLVTAALRDVFDYFLSAKGEEPLATVVSRLRAYLGHQLPAGAAIRANAILDQYLAWKAYLGDKAPMERSAGGRLDTQAVIAHRAQMRASRRRFMEPAVIDAFFAAEDARHAYGIQRYRILHDGSLSDVEKQRRLQALSHDYATAQEGEGTDYQDLQRRLAQLPKEAHSAARLRLLREQTVGPDAADRLEQLDRRRADFRRRLERWLQERQRILANSGLSGTEREQYLEQRRATYFDASELRRVLTLERLAR